MMLSLSKWSSLAEKKVPHPCTKAPQKPFLQDSTGEKSGSHKEIVEYSFCLKKEMVRLCTLPNLYTYRHHEAYFATRVYLMGINFFLGQFPRQQHFHPICLKPFLSPSRPFSLLTLKAQLNNMFVFGPGLAFPPGDVAEETLHCSVHFTRSMH